MKVANEALEKAGTNSNGHRLSVRKWRVAVETKALYLSASNRGNKKRDANKFLNGNMHGITVHGDVVPQSQWVSSQLAAA